MFEQLDSKKRYASHYLQLGSAYIRNAMLSFDEEHRITLAPFEREYPQTIFLSGTIHIYKQEEKSSLVIDKDVEISLEEMQSKLDEAPNSWRVEFP